MIVQLVDQGQAIDRRKMRPGEGGKPTRQGFGIHLYSTVTSEVDYHATRVHSLDADIRVLEVMMLDMSVKCNRKVSGCVCRIR